MAQRPDGKSSQADRVAFTRPAAERIAKTVRKVEAGDRDCLPMYYGSRLGGDPAAKVFRIATFTGEWAINSPKTVTFKYATNTPNTVSATNLFFPITNTATASRDCAIAKEGTAWFLIDVPMRTATAIFVTSTATSSLLTDMTLSASLNTSACTITIGKTLVTSSAIVVTGTVTGAYLTVEV